MCRFYGWSHDELFDLTMAQFRMYANEIDPVRKGEWRMDLAIATSPHTNEQNQRDLQGLLKEAPKRRGHVLTPEEARSKENLERALAARKNRK